MNPWSPLFRLAGTGLRVASAVGAVPDRLTPAALLEAARDRTGLDDFGDPDFRTPFRILVRAYETEAELTALGRHATRTDAVRLLSNRLRLVEDRKRHRAVAREEIRAPVVILGLPRTGTTLLHNLLTLDPANRVPRTWETMFLPPVEAGDRGRRVARCRRRLRWFGRLAPEYRKIHPTGPRLPQECIAITSHAFASVRFHRTHYVPSYRRWLEEADPRFAYALHRRFLQHLQHRRSAARWVLKTPAHLFALGTLLDTYPDARIVHTHRDPLTALASNASQARVLRGAFSRRPERMETDDTVRRWARALETAMDVRDARPGAGDRFLDLAHADLVEDPVREVRRLYAAHGLELTAEVARRMRRWVREHPRGKHGAHRYTRAEFGIDRERHGPLFARYRDRHGV